MLFVIDSEVFSVTVRLKMYILHLFVPYINIGFIKGIITSLLQNIL